MLGEPSLLQRMSCKITCFMCVNEYFPRFLAYCTSGEKIGEMGQKEIERIRVDRVEQFYIVVGGQ